MSELPIIEIDLDEHGHGSVKINGQEIAPAVHGSIITIETEAGKPSHVTLDLWAHQLKVRLPAEVVAEVREAYAADEQLADRVFERVLEHLKNRTRIG